MTVLVATIPFAMIAAEPKVHVATRLGNPATRFADPLKTPQDLRDMLRSEKLRADVDFIAKECGFAGDMADLRSAAETSNIRPLKIPVGMRLPFMSTRRNGRAVLLREVLWAGKEPIDAYEFYFVSAGRQWRVVTPKACANFWVEDRGQALSAPASPVIAERRVESEPIDPASVDPPPAAKPGECYARVILPPVYETVPQPVLTREARQIVEVIPAEHETVEERVLTRQASQQLVVVPAVTRVVTEQVMVKPAEERTIEIPAVYQTVTEQVLVKPAHTVWKKGADPLQKLDGQTGDIMCLVTVPAEYRTVEKQVLVTPATTRTETIPAEYETVEKTVVVTPARTETITIPAEYRSMTVTRVKTPEQTRVHTIPAAYGTSARTVLSQPGRIGWKRVLCTTNVTPDVIAEVQTRLASRGYDVGPIDGRLNARTNLALTAFQQRSSLATGGLTYETLDALGVRY